MPVELKYPFAKDDSGSIILADDATSRVDYYCIGCSGVMRRRQGTKRAHFAHKASMLTCSSESVLHMGFKELLYARIVSALNSSSELKMHWECDICDEIHQRNLLSKTKWIKKEHSFGKCRPDISLLDANNKLIIAIEVVVTHEPEESTLRFYKENNVTLIRFKLDDASAIDKLQNELLQPTSVDACLNPKCKDCDRYTLKWSLFIIKGKCWRCKSTVNISAIVNKRRRYYTSNEYTPYEVELANRFGANIHYRYSKTVGTKYYAHVCRRCNNISGQNFLFSEYIAPSFYGRIEHEIHDIGFLCNCKRSMGG